MTSPSTGQPSTPPPSMPARRTSRGRVRRALRLLRALHDWPTQRHRHALRHAQATFNGEQPRGRSSTLPMLRRCQRGWLPRGHVRQVVTSTSCPTPTALTRRRDALRHPGVVHRERPPGRRSTSTTLAANPVGFEGAAFDGRYVYLLCRYDNGGLGRRRALRLQATVHGRAHHGRPSTCRTLHLPARLDFTGRVFDGRYVYSRAPQASEAGRFNSIVARYDNQALFTASASWSTFDTSTVNARRKSASQGRAFRRALLVCFAPDGEDALTSYGILRWLTQAAVYGGAPRGRPSTPAVNARCDLFFGTAVRAGVASSCPRVTSVALRHQATFTASASWTTFNAGYVVCASAASPGPRSMSAYVLYLWLASRRALRAAFSSACAGIQRVVLLGWSSVKAKRRPGCREHADWSSGKRGCYDFPFITVPVPFQFVPVRCHPPPRWTPSPTTATRWIAPSRPETAGPSWTSALTSRRHTYP